MLQPQSALPAEYQKLALRFRAEGDEQRAAAYDLLALTRAALNDDLAVLVARRAQRARMAA